MPVFAKRKHCFEFKITKKTILTIAPMPCSHYDQLGITYITYKVAIIKDGHGRCGRYGKGQKTENIADNIRIEKT